MVQIETRRIDSVPGTQVLKIGLADGLSGWKEPRQFGLDETNPRATGTAERGSRITSRSTLWHSA
jgi:hypothetical protein